MPLASQDYLNATGQHKINRQFTMLYTHVIENKGYFSFLEKLDNL